MTPQVLKSKLSASNDGEGAWPKSDSCCSSPAASTKNSIVANLACPQVPRPVLRTLLYTSRIWESWIFFCFPALCCTERIDLFRNNKTESIIVTCHTQEVYLIYEIFVIINNVLLKRIKIIFNKYPVQWVTLHLELRCIHRALKKKLKDCSKQTYLSTHEGFSSISACNFL